MSTTPPTAATGTTIYTRIILPIYDFIVLNISCTYAWHCPTRTNLEPFFLSNTATSTTHLDIGVGTGYFPAKLAAANTQLRKVALVDLNTHALEHAAMKVRKAAQRRAGDVDVKTVVADARESIKAFEGGEGESGQRFDSVSLFLLLHCVPGSVEEKGRVFGVARRCVRPGGVVFGATVLGREDEGTGFNWFGRWLLRLYNRKGIFSNLGDTREGFVKELRKEFREVEEFMVGNVWLFRAIRGSGE